MSPFLICSHWSYLFHFLHQLSGTTLGWSPECQNPCQSLFLWIQPLGCENFLNHFTVRHLYNCHLSDWHLRKLKRNSFINASYLQLFTGCSLLTTFGVFVNALKTCCLQYCRLRRNMMSWLDHAKKKNGGCYTELHVEATKFSFTFLPLFIFQLLYKICIMQGRKDN